MVFKFTAAQSSGISKSRAKKPSLQRLTSSAFNNHPRQKPIQRPSSTKPSKDADEEPLEDTGSVITYRGNYRGENVEGAARYIQRTMFDVIPERRSGLNSTRTAETLNLRRALPPVISIPHLHCLLRSPSAVQRQLSELRRAGKTWKLTIPLQGVVSRSEDFLIFVDDWIESVDSSESLGKAVKEKLITFIRQAEVGGDSEQFTLLNEETVTLLREGFLVKKAHMQTEYSAQSDATVSGTMLSLARTGEAAIMSISRQPIFGIRSRSRESSGAFDDGAIPQICIGSDQFSPSLPGSGTYARLLGSAMDHLISLLQKHRHKESPLSNLREKWNGAIAGDDTASTSRLARGEFAGILPGRTKKWKQFHGLNFDFVLCECLGRGILELFDTGAVGLGVRKI